ncbi:MAG: glycosyltransferase [Heliobacteriaceae bacterium]|jgi:glycosyltransferase involved in cell wall biosynthesis|nr:glycosyltransferase [Heliobacteriaceae bacterium]
MEPNVNIIVPTHNLIKNEQADDFNLLISLLSRQTYPNIEVTIVDNASDDGTVEMLKDYKNKGFLNFYSERDTGKYSAINKGIMRTKAKYVAFLSCDDFYHDITAIYDVVNVMEDNEADFSFSPAYCRHPEGFVFLFAPAMYNAFQAIPCPRQGMMFRRAILEKMNYFDERFKIMSDMDLIIALIMHKANAVHFERNYTTYKLSKKAIEQEAKCIEETKLVFLKNFKHLYPIDDDTLNKMINYSKFPPALLEKLSTCFPPEDKELFFERCEQMHQLRLEAANGKR